MNTTSTLIAPPHDPDTFAVIDFETTGMTPARGARGTEIAAVLVRHGEIVGQYSSLIGSDAVIPPFIEELTGISTAMIRSAPPAAQVMREVSDFTLGCGLVAHNASFDRHFWVAERHWAGCGDPAEMAPERPRPGELPPAPPQPGESLQPVKPTPETNPPAFVCTLLLSRRLYPQAPNHRLGTLASYHALPDCGRAHRALADALTTAHLLIRMQREIADRYATALDGRAVNHALLRHLQRAPKDQLARHLAQYRPGR